PSREKADLPVEERRFVEKPQPYDRLGGETVARREVCHVAGPRPRRVRYHARVASGWLVHTPRPPGLRSERLRAPPEPVLERATQLGKDGLRSALAGLDDRAGAPEPEEPEPLQVGLHGRVGGER